MPGKCAKRVLIITAWAGAIEGVFYPFRLESSFGRLIVDVALLGSAGMLGAQVAEKLRRGGHTVLTPSHAEVNLSKPHSLERFFEARSFQALVNCAAFTRVDACEEAAWHSEAFSVNGVGVGWLAKFCRQSGRTLIHFSTDYVFDGEKEEPYGETDIPNPINAYGRTKRQGEKLLMAEKPDFYLIRTSWLYGPGGRHFVKTMMELFRVKSKVEVVTNQMGTPTYTLDVASFLSELLDKQAPLGIYHFANQDRTSWYDFALEIQKQTGMKDCKIVPTLSENIIRPARRPANSVFDLSKATAAVGHSFRSWQAALEEYLSGGAR